MNFHKILNFSLFTGYSHLIGKLCEYRNGLTEVSTYAEIPVPLVYTQVHIIYNTFHKTRTTEYL